MDKKYFSKRLGIAVVLGLVMVLQSTNAFARDNNRGRPKAREVIAAGQKRYSHQESRFYRPGWFRFDIVLGFAHPPLGAVVAFLPFGHGSVVIGGLTYYHHGNNYYRACPLGYVVVPQPQVSQHIIARQNLSGEKVSVNIPNSNGSYTTIVLLKQKDGYAGPQGEYYPGQPTIEQLKVLYGK
ncbi:MAG: DUF6515 family protein [Candidatus Omnitrophota bacterium]